MPVVRSIQQIQKELNAQQARLKKLQAQRSKIAKALRGVDAEISAITGEAPSAGRPATKKAPAKKQAPAKTGRKAKGSAQKGSLRALLAEAISGTKGLSVKDAAAAVLAAGYATKSKDFRLIVNQTLLKCGEFEKVARGVYALKG